MPRRRPKARIEHIADALDHAAKAAQCLAEIDLRTTSGELREFLRTARGANIDLRESLQEALLADKPTPPARQIHTRV